MKINGSILITTVDGYTAEVTLDESGEFLHGRILVHNDVITFESDTGIIKEMKLSIADYLKFKNEIKSKHHREKTDEEVIATIESLGGKVEDYDKNWVRKK